MAAPNLSTVSYQATEDVIQHGFSWVQELRPLYLKAIEEADNDPFLATEKINKSILQDVRRPILKAECAAPDKTTIAVRVSLCPNVTDSVEYRGLRAAGTVMDEYFSFDVVAGETNTFGRFRPEVDAGLRAILGMPPKPVVSIDKANSDSNIPHKDVVSLEPTTPKHPLSRYYTTSSRVHFLLEPVINDDLVELLVIDVASMAGNRLERNNETLHTCKMHNRYWYIAHGKTDKIIIGSDEAVFRLSYWPNKVPSKQ